MRARPIGRLLALLLAIGMTATACDGADEDGPTVDYSENTAELTVEETGALGARVYLEPDRAGELVRGAGLTPAGFEARVRAITADPALSLTYARGFEEVIWREADPPDVPAEDGTADDEAGDVEPSAG